MDFLNQKGGVKRILLKGELKIFQQRGAKLPLGHTLNWGVQMKKKFRLALQGRTESNLKKIPPMAS